MNYLVYPTDFKTLLDVLRVLPMELQPEGLDSVAMAVESRYTPVAVETPLSDSMASFGIGSSTRNVALPFLSS